MNILKKKIKCPRCGGNLTIEITEKALREAENSPSGMTAITIPHGDHQVIVYIDRNAGIRGTNWAVIPTKPVINMFKEIPIPVENAPDIRALSRDELRFFALCDGVRDLRRIAILLNIPYPKVRLMAERLRSRGYIELKTKV